MSLYVCVFVCVCGCGPSWVGAVCGLVCVWVSAVYVLMCVGCPGGGRRYMAACYALKYPERVSHLVLASPAGGRCSLTYVREDRCCVFDNNNIGHITVLYVSRVVVGRWLLLRSSVRFRFRVKIIFDLALR